MATASRALRTRTTRRSRRRNRPSDGGSGGAALVVAIIVSGSRSACAQATSASPVNPPAALPLPGHLPREEDLDPQTPTSIPMTEGSRSVIVLSTTGFPVGRSCNRDDRAVRHRHGTQRCPPRATTAALAVTGSPRCWWANCRPVTGSSPRSRARRSWSCILGNFYGNNSVESDVNQATRSTATRPGSSSHTQLRHQGAQDQGRAVDRGDVSAGARSGLYYASIPDTTPELIQPARDLILQLESHRVAITGSSARSRRLHRHHAGRALAYPLGEVFVLRGPANIGRRRCPRDHRRWLDRRQRGRIASCPLPRRRVAIAAAERSSEMTTPEAGANRRAAFGR